MAFLLSLSDSPALRDEAVDGGASAVALVLAPASTGIAVVLLISIERARREAAAQGRSVL